MKYILDYNYSQHFLHVMDVKLCHQHDMLQQIRDAMHCQEQEIRRSSPSFTPTTHKKEEEIKSMLVVSAPSQSAAPLALSSQLHSTGNRQVILRAEYSAGRIDFLF
jgi:hypothetical protein